MQEAEEVIAPSRYMESARVPSFEGMCEGLALSSHRGVQRLLAATAIVRGWSWITTCPPVIGVGTLLGDRK